MTATPHAHRACGPVVILGGADVQAEAVEAAHALGREVHVVAAHCGDAARAAADVVVTLDLTDVDGVTAYAEQVGAAAVYSVGSDLAMPVVAEVTQRLGLPALVSPGTADLCHHKHQARALLQDAPGSVRHATVTRADGPDPTIPVPLPVIVKPDDAQGQRGLSLVTDWSQLAAALDHALSHSRNGRAVVEEYIAGPEISVNGFLQDGTLVFVGVSDREVWPDHVGLVRGHRFPARAATGPSWQEAVAVLDHACRAIGLRDGPVYAQMIVGPDGVRLVEVSPRLDGCHLWRLWLAVTGVDLLRAALNLACGEVAPLTADRPLVPVLPDEDEPVTTIDFDCLPPGSTAPGTELVPAAGENVLDQARYYAPGALVRPVNGRMEKIGWTLRQRRSQPTVAGTGG